MIGSIYKGTVREFNSATKQAKLVVPQLYDFEPIWCEPFLMASSVVDDAPLLSVGQQVLVVWDGGQSNAKPFWMLPGMKQTNPWTASWGVVAIGSVVMPQPVNLAAAATIDLTSVLNFTPLLGRRYRVNLHSRAVAVGNNTEYGARVFLANGAGPTQESEDRWVSGAVNYASQNAQWLISGDGVARTWKVRADSANASAAIGFYPTQYYVEDMGPSTSPALPMPVIDPPWTPLTLGTGWAPFSVTEDPAQWEQPRIRRIGDIVYIEGLVTFAGTGTVNVQIASLEAQYRPKQSHLKTCALDKTGTGVITSTRIHVYNSGEVAFSLSQGTGPVVYISLDDIYWSVT